MKGLVEIYAHTPTGKHKVFSESNMIVEGAKMAVVDMLTFTPPTSAVSSVALMSVSSFGVHAITMGSPSLNFSKHDSRHAVSKSHGASTQYLHVSGTGSGIHALHKDTPNRLLTDTTVRYQPKYDSLVETADLSKAILNVFGSPVVYTDGGGIHVTADHGQDYVLVDIVVPGSYAVPYMYRVQGTSNTPIGVSFIAIDTVYGGTLYLNPNTQKYGIHKETSERTFNSRGVFEVEVSPNYSLNTSINATKEFRIRLELPRADWETKGSATIQSLKTFLGDDFIVNNPNFAKTTDWLVNSDFSEYTENLDILKSFSDAYGIVNFRAWDIISNYSTGYNISDVGYVGREILGDGVHIQASSTEGIGSARLSQKFHQNYRTYDAFMREPIGSPFSGFATLTFDLLSETVGANGLRIQLKDITSEEWYTFSLDGGLGSWGYNEPMIVGNVSVGEWRTYSTAIPVAGREGHLYEITFIGDGTGSAMAGYTLRSIRFGQVQGWNFGNKNIRMADYEEGTGVVLSSTQTTVEGENYSSLTYIGQKFIGMAPEKAYNLVIDAETLSGESTRIGVAITHRSFGNVSGRRGYNAARDIGMLDLTKATNSKTLNTGYSYYLSPTTSPSAVTDQYGTAVDSQGYKSSNAAVLFDAAFQQDSQRLFYQSNALSRITMDTEVSSTVEEYYMGLRIRGEGAMTNDLYYRFATNKWVPVSRASVSVIGDSNYSLPISRFSGFPVHVPVEFENDYATDGIYSVCLEFRSSLNGEERTSEISNGFFIKDISIVGYNTNASSTEFYNGSNSVRSLHYDGSGGWVSETSVTRPLYAGTSVPVGSVIEIDVNSSSTNTIPIWGQAIMGTLTDNYIGSVNIGANFESTYDVTIFPLSGEGVHLKSVGLTDYALSQYGGEADIRDRDLKTSEYKWGSIPFIEGGWHIHPQTTNDTTYPKVEVNTVYGKNAILFTKNSANPRNAIIAHTMYVSSIGLLSNSFKVSFDHVEGLGVSVTLKYGILYKRENPYGSDEELVWDFTDLRWKAYQNGVLASSYIDGLEDVTVFPYAGGNSDKYENYISNTITTVKHPRGSDMITVFIRVSWLAATAQSAITNLRYYSIVSPVEASSLFPEFPNPNDTSIQPTTDGPGELGHFLNKMEFRDRGIPGIANYEEAVYDGCYPEASGTTIFSGGSFLQSYGNLNEYGVITPNGFILEQKVVDRSSQVLLDSSAGMVVSAVSPVSSTQQVAYSITLTRDEWEMVNTYYGGLGALGLWTINYTETAKKFGSDEGLGGPPFLSSGTPTSLLTTGSGGSPAVRNSASAGPEFINGPVLVAKATSSSGLTLFHTGAGAPRGRVNPNGWCVSGDSYTLVFEYKAIGDNVKLRSDNFPDVSLSSDGIWHREVVTFTASATGHNKIGVLLRKASNPTDIQTPKILVASALLTNDTSSVTVKSFDFTDVNQLDAFSTKYLTYNSIEPLSIGWDGDFYATSLYNSSVLVDREPIFRLFSKKVFFPGGLQIDPSSNFITVTWVIDF